MTLLESISASTGGTSGLERTIDAGDLIHGLHPRSENHSTKDPSGAAAGDELDPSKAVEMLTVENIFDDGELRFHGRRFWCSAVALESSNDI